MKTVTDTLAEHGKKVDKLVAALVGNDWEQGTGLAGRVKDLETETETLKKEIENLKGDAKKSVIYINLLWGAAGVIITGLFAIFLKH